MLITTTLIKDAATHLSKFVKGLEYFLANQGLCVFLDNGSTDGTYELLQALTLRHPDQVYLIQNDLDFNLEEKELRSILWEEVRKIIKDKKINQNKTWILSLDSDEIVPTETANHIMALVENTGANGDNEFAALAGVEAVIMRLKEIWDEDKMLYRVDGNWSPYFKRLFKFQDTIFSYNNLKGLHQGSIPDFAQQSQKIKTIESDIYHYSYSTPEKREAKSKYYLEHNKDVFNRTHALTILETPSLEPTEKPTPKFAICSLIHDRRWALKYFLKSLEMSIVPTGTRIYFLANNCEKKTLEDLEAFKKQNPNYIVDIEIYNFDLTRPHGNHDWDGELLWRMAQMRNKCLDYGKKHKLDSIISIDSDLVFDENAINHLIQSDKDIISPVFWANWNGNRLNQKLPQVWQSGGYEISEGFLNQLKHVQALFRVGGLGAFTKISKKVWEAGVNYNRVHNLPQQMTGEDRDFCIRAVVAGFDLWASTYHRLMHLDSEKMLDEVLKDGSLKRVMGSVRWAWAL